MSVLYLAHLVLWEVAPVIHVDSFPCSYIFIVAICYVCHIMKTQLYFRPNLRCKCVVLQEGGSWTGCRGARCRGARDGHLRLWYQGRKHHPLNRKFRFFWQTYTSWCFQFAPTPAAALEKRCNDTNVLLHHILSYMYHVHTVFILKVHIRFG